jgi:hypothetical protein
MPEITLGPRRAYFISVLLLIVVLACELVLSIRQQSQTIDEGQHILAGHQYWKHRDFGSNPEHPPLVKLVAGLPLLSLDLNPTAVLSGPTKAANANAVVPFLYQNRTGADTILFRTRIAASLLTFLLAGLLLLGGYEMLGPVPALLGLALLVFDPNILANGALVTTDLGESCFLFTAVYAFYRYVKKKDAANLACCGVAVTLALAAKHSGLVILPILVLLAASELLSGSTTRDSFGKQTVRLAAALAAIVVIGCAGLWVFYTFRYSARPEGATLNPPLDVFAHTLRTGLQSTVVLALARFHVLPESYLWGLTDILVATEGRATFLLGRVYETGQWFYFPLVFLMKSTLPFLAFLAAAPFALRGRGLRRELLYLTLPPVVFLATSMSSGLNLGIRHILPIFPFLILIAAVSAWNVATRFPILKWPVALLLLGHAATSLHVYPNYLTYSNEIAGGPSNSYRLMTDSNVDWSQGLKQSAVYIAQHHITECWFANRIAPQLYGIPCKPLPNGLTRRQRPVAAFPPMVEGTIFISANEAAGQAWGPGELNPYRQFFERPPDDIVANSILVFRGPFDLSRAAALNRSARAQQFLSQKKLNDALSEVQTAAQLAPGSAEVQATLCEVMKQMNRKEEGEPACQLALSIARRVHPEYQFLRVPAVRAIAPAR